MAAAVGRTGWQGPWDLPTPPTLGGWSLRPWPPTPDWGLWLSERGAPFLGPALEGGLSPGGGLGPGGRSGVTGRETVQILPHDFGGLSVFQGPSMGWEGGSSETDLPGLTGRRTQAQPRAEGRCVRGEARWCLSREGCLGLRKWGYTPAPYRPGRQDSN